MRKCLKISLKNPCQLPESEDCLPLRLRDHSRGIVARKCVDIAFPEVWNHRPGKRRLIRGIFLALILIFGKRLVLRRSETSVRNWASIYTYIFSGQFVP